MDSSSDPARARRRRLDRAIELKAFEIACVEAIAGRWAGGSERAWLLSIFESTLGVALAVTRARAAGQWAQQAAALREELTQLRVERRLLDLSQ